MSRLCLLAIKAYHRAERDAFAEMGQAMGICEARNWPNASRRAGTRNSNKICTRIWTWARARWDGFANLEYENRT